MIKQEMIEEHPINQPALWVSNIVITPKADESRRMTLDTRNVNKAIIPTNPPVPLHEDIKSKLAGCTFFSKMDFKSAFWKIKLEDSSRYVTVFHANDKLYRYKRLIMGIKPGQGEFNVALKSIFMHIDNIHLIHDDLIIATRTMSKHIAAIREVMQAISNAGLTLNPGKYKFGYKEIKFRGMIFSADGMGPDPDKIGALNFITAPTNKDDLIIFLCIIQSNSNVIQNFTQKPAPLREMIHHNIHFKWKPIHQKCFESLI